ncbi:MAG TPA: DUF1289 domain-containing protein [Steroidobacteraceae bacterium]|nr:DUF1289 domain-containing protein [Steroidobacteraceae bacterium]
MASGASADPLEPASPCINICKLDERGYCTGCLRSLAEIACWSSLSKAERWQVLEAVEERRQALTRATVS